MAKIKRRKWSNASGDHEAFQLDFTDRHGKRHREQFGKKRHAEARMAELQAETSKGTYRPLAERHTVTDACREYCEYMETRADNRQRVTETYLRTVRQHCENWIDPDSDYVKRKPDQERLDRVGFSKGIGAIRLGDLTTRRVVQLRDDMQKHGAGIVTQRRVLGTLSRILKHAVEKDMAAVNVAKGVQVIGTRDEGRERVKPPSKATLAALLSKAGGQFKLAIQFAAASGLRASEQWALRWRHIDLEAGSVTVEERVDAFGNIDTTKSEAGVRTVPIGKAIVTALRAQHAATKHKKPGDFVFTNTRGGFLRHTNLTKKQWAPLIEAAGIDDLGWHSLRHFAVSTWIEAGLNPKAIQTLAGHSSYQFTMTRYGHLFPSEDHKSAFDKLAETLA